MRIAILGWGSLIWDSRLNIEPTWHLDGPVLRIEFSKVSGRYAKPRRRYLSLVIDPDHGGDVRAQYAMSREEALDAAVRDLAKRETGDPDKTDNMQNVLASSREVVGEPAHVSRIRAWLREKDFDAAVWTAFAPNFDVTGKPFTHENALAFLESLPPEEAGRAWEYIERAPTTTETPFRRFLRTARGRGP